MAKGNTALRPKYPIIFETFRDIGSYEVVNLSDLNPSCFNNWMRVRKYKITIELIEEPIEIIQERIKKIWRECDNHHHWGVIKKSAEEYGVELNMDDMGKDRKR